MIEVIDLNSGTITSGDVSLIAELINSYRNNKVILYINYVKGDELSLDIQLQVTNVNDDGTTWYNDNMIDSAGNVIPKRAVLTQSGVYAVSFDYDIVNKARLEINLTGAATAPGTVSIKYDYDNLYQ